MGGGASLRKGEAQVGGRKSRGGDEGRGGPGEGRAGPEGHEGESLGVGEGMSLHEMEGRSEKLGFYGDGGGESLDAGMRTQGRGGPGERRTGCW